MHFNIINNDIWIRVSLNINVTNYRIWNEITLSMPKVNVVGQQQLLQLYDLWSANLILLVTVIHKEKPSQKLQPFFPPLTTWPSQNMC